MRLAVLASGTGSILDSIVEAGIDVSLVLTDRECSAAQNAKALGLEVKILERKEYGKEFQRYLYTAEIVEVLEKERIELIAMAGFGTILDRPIYEKYEGKILNTHPSLLPAFPGWHAVEETLAYGCKMTGCTVHLATLEVDSGPILAQEAVEVFENDDVVSLHERIKEVERKLYVDIIKEIMKV